MMPLKWNWNTNASIDALTATSTQRGIPRWVACKRWCTPLHTSEPCITTRKKYPRWLPTSHCCIPCAASRASAAGLLDRLFCSRVLCSMYLLCCSRVSAACCKPTLHLLCRGQVSADHVFLHKGIHSGQALLAYLQHAENLLQQQQLNGRQPVRLIVIDSIASVFRDLGNNPQVIAAWTGASV